MKPIRPLFRGNGRLGTPQCHGTFKDWIGDPLRGTHQTPLDARRGTLRIQRLKRPDGLGYRYVGHAVPKYLSVSGIVARARERKRLLERERVKHNEPLGKSATREEARRKADRWIMRNGINDREKLEFALQPREITFRAQAAWWLSELASGRLKSRQKNKRGQRIRVSTLDAYTTAVAYLNEKIGDRMLATFDNGEMKELISTMEAETRANGERRFTPKTIVNYYLIAAAVFATAKDRKGKQLFPRQWDLNYIGLPAVDKKTQKTPTVEATEIETILGAAKRQLYRVLYCSVGRVRFADF